MVVLGEFPSEIRKDKEERKLTIRSRQGVGFETAQDGCDVLHGYLLSAPCFPIRDRSSCGGGDDVLCVFCSSSFPNNGSRSESTTSPSLVLPSSSPVVIRCQLCSFYPCHPHHPGAGDTHVLPTSLESQNQAHIPLTTLSTISVLLSPSGANRYAVAVSESSILNVGGGDKQKGSSMLLDEEVWVIGVMAEDGGLVGRGYCRRGAMPDGVGGEGRGRRRGEVRIRWDRTGTLFPIFSHIE